MLIQLDNFILKKDSLGTDALGGMRFVLQEFEQKHKLPLIGIPQTINVLGPATLTLESMIREGNIRIRKDPVWKHCVASVALHEGINGVGFFERRSFFERRRSSWPRFT